MSTPDALEERYNEIGRKAVVANHKPIRAFMDTRRFDDEGFVRALLVEYIKFSAVAAAKASDAEL